tara:strand:- start:79421 stop:80866 length:1446 start_codon:yes stop_codon:yes gene_type:complete
MTHYPAKIILVDDDTEMREMLFDFLSSQGHTVVSFPLATEAFEAMVNDSLVKFSVNEADLIITDLAMPEMDGLEFIQRSKKRLPGVPMILVTAFGTIESAIESTKAGAYAYVVKPFKLNEFEVTLRQALTHNRLQRENILLRGEVAQDHSFHKIIGKSKAMRQVFDLIKRVANASANILVTGDSGTGKEMVANAIHELGARSKKPFVAINCTAIPDNLLESELFGHVKGSFTGAISDKIGLFEEANGGTLFLDEIGDLDLNLQAKLLRVLQEKTIKPVGSNKTKQVDVRIIAATHKDLKKAIKDETFREDLFYRLCVIPVEIPSLKERREDIPLLVNHFVKKYAVINNSPVKGFSPRAMQKMLQNSWEGNVRELENYVERLVVLSTNEWIEESEVMLGSLEGGESVLATAVNDWPSLAELEKRYILAVLEKVGGRKEKASQILGINRRTLYRKELEYSGQESKESARNDHETKDDGNSLRH